MNLLGKKPLLFAVVCTLLFTLPAWPQAASSLTGTVTDPTGAVMPGAKAILIHVDTGVTRETTTSSRGIYVFAQLAPGIYRLTVTQAGFKTALHDRVIVRVASAMTLDVSLELGAVTETVEVEAATAAINTRDASMGTAFTGLQVEQIPMEGRNVVGLLSLQAGATFIPGSAGERSGSDTRSGSIFGSRSDQTNVTLDGVDVNDPQFNYAYTSTLRMTLDSLAEFRVTTTNYNADLGRSSAAQVSLVTKSGTNELHGSAYWYHRNEATAANEWFLNKAGIPKRKLRKHIFGASLGGPIVKDRVFLFGNWEDLRRSTEASAVRDVPSWAYRHGYLQYECEDSADARCAGGAVTIAGQTVAVPAGYYLLTPADMTLLDIRPWSTEPFCDPASTTAGCGANQFALEYFQRYVTPNDFTRGDGVNLVGYRFAAPIKDTFHTYVVRADFNLTATGSHTLFWRGNLQDDQEESTPQFPGQSPTSLTLTNNKGFAVGYTGIINPNVVNSFRYGLTRIKEEVAGLQTTDFFDFRFIDEVENYSSNSYGRTIPAHHLRDDLSWTRGSHTLGFGVDVRFTRNDRYSNQASFHNFSSNPSWVIGVGGAITPGEFRCASPWGGCTSLPAVASGFRSDYHDAAENLLAMYSQVNSNYNYDRTGAILPHGEPIPRRYGADEYEFYLQDAWRATPALTITYGVRYGLYSPPWETNGDQVSPTLSLGRLFETRGRNMRAGIPDNANPKFGFELAGPANNRRGYYDWDYNNWSPRIAVAWAPRFKEGFLGTLFGEGKMVIRGGYSLVYDRIGHGLATTFDEEGSFGMSTSLATPYGTTMEETAIRFTGTFNIPPGVLQAAPPGGYPQTPPADWNTIDWGLDDTIVTPYSHVMNLSIAREFPGDFTIEVGYVGRRGRHLLVQRDLFMPLDLCDPASGTCYFEAAQQLIQLAEQGQDILTMGPIPYWENMFPSFGPTGTNAGQLGCDVWGVDPGYAGGLSATQVAYDLWMCMEPDYSYAPYVIDLYGAPGSWTTGDPSYAVTGPYSFFNDVYNALAAWSSVGRSEYHGMVLSVRKRMSHGVQFGFNYTLSKSRDHTSEAEYAGTYGGIFTGGYSGFLVNSWSPELSYSYSDFDMRHQVNANWVVEMPLGHGRALGSGVAGWVNQIIGGWQVSGLFRTSSGLPANSINGRSWPTNWNVQGNATCIDQQECPATKTTMLPDGPNLYADPEAAFDQFRWSMPGEIGERNILRGDGYFVIDFGLGKRFTMPTEGHSLQFRWEVFNITNSVSFDTNSLQNSIGSPGTFGYYQDVLGPADGGARVMQFALRYEF
jgi:hypothetical protein